MWQSLQLTYSLNPYLALPQVFQNATLTLVQLQKTKVIVLAG